MTPPHNACAPLASSRIIYAAPKLPALRRVALRLAIRSWLQRDSNFPGPRGAIRRIQRRVQQTEDVCWFFANIRMRIPREPPYSVVLCYCCFVVVVILSLLMPLSLATAGDMFMGKFEANVRVDRGSCHVSGVSAGNKEGDSWVGGRLMRELVMEMVDGEVTRWMK
ncbi:Protein of unknown function [Gryllus bimaculatus]|nr:Protein of unknown function [Gryllus bimaculatus]